MEMRLLTLACMVGLIGPIRLSAACPEPPPPCEAMAKADVVFVGEVVELSIFMNTSQPEAIHQYRFNVIEPFKASNPENCGPCSMPGLKKTHL